MSPQDSKQGSNVPFVVGWDTHYASLSALARDAKLKPERIGHRCQRASKCEMCASGKASLINQWHQRVCCMAKHWHVTSWDDSMLLYHITPKRYCTTCPHECLFMVNDVCGNRVPHQQFCLWKKKKKKIKIYIQSCKSCMTWPVSAGPLFICGKAEEGLIKIWVQGVLKPEKMENPSYEFR